MPPPLKNVPTVPRPAEDITLLLLTPHAEDETAIRNVVHHPGWKVERKEKLVEARTALSRAAIVLCDPELPDSDWKNVLEALAGYDNPPLLIVMSYHADEVLWADVLNRGGYDVLLKPFETSEVMRVISIAWRHRKSVPPERKAAGAAAGIALSA